MRKRILIATAAVAGVMGVSASSAMATTPDRASDPFVCPVVKISDQAASHSDQFITISGGDHSILPGNAGSQETFNGNVPSNATNSDGAGSPGGAHASPGDAGYSAVWSGN
jgi:hypothetical protein